MRNLKSLSHLLFWVPLLALAGGFAAFLPCAKILYKERELAETIKKFAHTEFAPTPQSQAWSDDRLRGRVQTLARAAGFALAFEDVFVRYAADKNQTFEKPAKVGYTLSVVVPLFGFIDVPLLVVRVFDVSIVTLERH